MASPRLVPLVILLAGIGVIGGALLFQFVGGLQPCELCYYERWPWYAAMVLALAVLAWGRRDAAWWLAVAGALLFLGGGLLSFYHVGVEQHWFAGPTACSGPTAAADSLEALKAQILGQKPVRCDEVQWSLFGVSLAGWNLVASAALLVFCLGALHRRRTA